MGTPDPNSYSRGLNDQNRVFGGYSTICSHIRGYKEIL